MKIPPVALTVRGAKDNFASALLQCEKQKKIPPNYVNHNAIKCLPYDLGKEGEIKPQDTGLIADNIRHALRTSEGLVFVDAVTCGQSLALLNRYKVSWNITDDIVEKFYAVVYDKRNPQKVELIQNIEEALRLQEQYERAERFIYITKAGYAGDFLMSLSKNKKVLDVELPELNSIVEIDPKNAETYIKSKLVSGKKVFVDQTLLISQPALVLMLKSLPTVPKSRLVIIH